MINLKDGKHKDKNLVNGIGRIVKGIVIIGGSTIVEEAKSIFGFDENHKLAYSQLFSQCFQHEVSC